MSSVYTTGGGISTKVLLVAAADADAIIPVAKSPIIHVPEMQPIVVKRTSQGGVAEASPSLEVHKSIDKILGSEPKPAFLTFLVVDAAVPALHPGRGAFFTAVRDDSTLWAADAGSFGDDDAREIHAALLVLASFYMQRVVGTMVVSALAAGASKGDDSLEAGVYTDGCGSVPNAAKKAFDVARSVYVLPAMPHSLSARSPALAGFRKFPTVRTPAYASKFVADAIGNMLCIVPRSDIIDVFSCLGPELTYYAMKLTFLGKSMAVSAGGRAIDQVYIHVCPGENTLLA